MRGGGLPDAVSVWLGGVVKERDGQTHEEDGEVYIHIPVADN